ncbi:hypothetical protein GPECTOR_46g266 [Gonium pectorale]|uniref:Uncharacterized protein n=1 Tax=Gonium pectorale TaxID=33097 RepID=A0A150G8M5_GONPE|nr:hypothetical protein GPECTOR_46g266 [Gonium pectorale]|eukprot:KXZ46197.1 hypothetical protein GPECTOR_46g266 [Gonium pectorale]
MDGEGNAWAADWEHESGANLWARIPEAVVEEEPEIVMPDDEPEPEEEADDPDRDEDYQPPAHTLGRRYSGQNGRRCSAGGGGGAAGRRSGGGPIDYSFYARGTNGQYNRPSLPGRGRGGRAGSGMLSQRSGSLALAQVGSPPEALLAVLPTVDVVVNLFGAHSPCGSPQEVLAEYVGNAAALPLFRHPR